MPTDRRRRHAMSTVPGSVVCLRFWRLLGAQPRGTIHNQARPSAPNRAFSSNSGRRHVEFGPQMTAALRGSLSDTRTQGTITVQLILDQLRASSHVDSTLDGPTSGAWLNHWHNFLAVQDVRFRRGHL